MFDHNNEPLSQPLKKKKAFEKQIQGYAVDQIKYRRKEYKLKRKLYNLLKLVIGIGVINLLALTIGDFMALKYADYWKCGTNEQDNICQWRFIIDIMFSATICIIGVFLMKIFLKLYFKMEKKSNQLFMKNKRSLQLFSLVLISVVAFWGFCIVGNKFFDLHAEPVKIVAIYCNGVVFLPQLFLCLNVVLFKSTDDVIQGVNKLDYLLKVSCFQVYRKTRLDCPSIYYDFFPSTYCINMMPDKDELMENGVKPKKNSDKNLPQNKSILKKKKKQESVSQHVCKTIESTATSVYEN